jgi:molecular chaperone DnaK (HSP70)
MDKTRLVYGIDLGTTYSCIAMVDEFDKPVVLENSEGDFTTPSIVYINGTTVSVGITAKAMLAEEPENTVAFIKREIGKDDSFKKPTRFPNNLDPAEISALILKKLVNDANKGLPTPIKDVVITCPAYFGTKERLQTRQAGEMIGLNVIQVINEPTAAAIAYGIKLKNENRKVIVVYDLGGGTFDVTVICVDGGNITVVATGGDHALGGYNWDMAIAQVLLDAYNDEHSTDLTLESDRRLTNALLLEVEQKKKILTSMPEVNANVQYNGKSSRIKLTREQFDAETLPLLNKTITMMKETLEIARKDGFEPEEIVLVGGSSRMPQVGKRVKEEFKLPANFNEPDKDVAKGALLYAVNEEYKKAYTDYKTDLTGDVVKPSVIKGGGELGSVTNVTSKTYGTDVTGGVSNLIFANTKLPASKTGIFKTQTANQSYVPMKVFESDVTDREKEVFIPESAARLLEDHDLKLSKNYPAKTNVPVTFEIDREGVLSVHAEVGNGSEKDIIDFKLTITGVKSEEQMVQSAKIIAGLNVQGAE